MGNYPLARFLHFMPPKKKIQKKDESLTLPEKTADVSLPAWLRDEQAPISTDYIRQYVGTYMNVPAPSSGVYLNKDRVWQTQQYMELWGYDLFDFIEQDPHVAAIMWQRKLAVSGLDYSINPASDDKKDKQIAVFVERTLRRLSGFHQDLVELSDAVGKGFSVSEIMWGVNAQGYIVPIDILNRPQRRFQFDAATRELKVRNLDNPFYGDPLTQKKFICHRISSKYNNPFGDPLDSQIYWMWKFKHTAIMFWMQNLQTSAAPIPIVKTPANASQELKNAAMKVASQIRSGAFATMSENLLLEWGEAKTSGEAGKSFAAFQQFADDQMTKCVLGQLLTTEAGGRSGTGSRALGEVHGAVKQDILQYDAHALEDTLNATLIKWMVDFNFAGVEDYPQISFDVEQSKDILQVAQALLAAKQAGANIAPSNFEDLGIDLDENQPMLDVAPPEPKPKEGIAA